TTRGQVALLRERDQTLRDRAQALGLVHGGGDGLVLEELRSHVVEHDALVRRRASEAVSLGGGGHCSVSLEFVTAAKSGSVLLVLDVRVVVGLADFAEAD